MMSKRDYFLAWLKNKLFYKRVNVLRMFGTNIPERIYFETSPIDKHNNLIQNPNNDNYVLLRNEDNFYTIVDGEEISLGKWDINTPFIDIHELLTLNPGDLPTITEITKTYYGVLFVNYYCFTDMLDTKFPYLNKHIDNATVIEKMLFAANKLEKDDPKYLDIETEINPVRTRIQQLENYSFLFVPAATIKTTRTPTDILALKDKLLEEKKGPDGLYTAQDIAEIKGILAKAYKEYVESDPDYGSMITGKSWGNTLLAMKVMIGAIARFDKPGYYSIITDSFADGTNIDDWTALTNTARSGSYHRGFETQLTGVEFKLLLRVINNIITMEDCGTENTFTVTLDKGMLPYYKDRYYNDNGEIKVVPSDESLLNKTIQVYSPLLCKATGIGLCLKCMGKQFKGFEKNIPVMSSEPAGNMTQAMMKAMHKDDIELHTYDIMKDIF